MDLVNYYLVDIDFYFLPKNVNIKFSLKVQTYGQIPVHHPKYVLALQALDMLAMFVLRTSTR